MILTPLANFVILLCTNNTTVVLSSDKYNIVVVCMLIIKYYGVLHGGTLVFFSETVIDAVVKKLS